MGEVVPMKIQIIGEKVNFETHRDITQSTFDAPRSLDEFDVNIIDLSNEKVWYNFGDNIRNVNRSNDFKSIQTMVRKKRLTKVVFVFPQNGKFYYNYGYSGYNASHESYLNSVVIKDRIGVIYDNIIEKMLPTGILPIQPVFEPTKTSITPNTYEADFYFEGNYPVLTKSNYSDKATTIHIPSNEIYLTTLNIMVSADMLLHFLYAMFGNKVKSDIPEWMSNIRFGDDEKQREIIRSSLEMIKIEQQKIESAEQKIEENDRYKSILYTNGDELVEVVFEILEKLLDCDLSDFVDKKKEDFLIKKSGCTFIGEIKGITSNVKNANITQVELHYQEYTDKLSEGGQSEKVQPILIINPSRNKEPQQRDPVDEQQIALARRNNCLIIETMTLLRIFEKFLAGEISSDKCIEVFSTCTGLLNESHFDSSTPEELEAYKG